MLKLNGNKNGKKQTNIKQIQELFVENINQNSKICTAFMQFVKLFSCNRLMFSVVLVISELL